MCERVGRFLLEVEIDGDRDGDDAEQHQQELPLLNQVGFAGLEDDLGDGEHRLMGRLPMDLKKLPKADAERAGDDQGAVKEEVEGADAAEAVEFSLVQIRDLQIRFAGERCGPGKQQDRERPCELLEKIHTRFTLLVARIFS